MAGRNPKSEKPGSTVVAIYIRKSREGKEEASRLEYQRKNLPLAAEKLGGRYEVYDEGFASAASGKTESLKERARLEQDICNGKVSIVLVIELSRLSRDETAVDYFKWLALCAEHGVKLATPSRLLDPQINSDWMLLMMEGGFSTVEMRTTSTRFREGREQRFMAGKWMGGTPPPPYKFDRNLDKPVVDKEKLLGMQKLWKMAESKSAKAIAEELGKPEISVRRAIEDKRLDIYQAKRMHPGTGEMINCNWEPVMGPEQAERIKAARRTRKTNNESRPFAALLSALDILRCGYCGKTGKTWRNSKKRQDESREDYYGCQQKNSKSACPKSRIIPQSILDEKILTNVFRTLGCLERLMEAWHASQNDSDITPSLDELKNRENRLLQKKERLIAAVAEGVLGLDEVKKQKTGIESEISSIERERKEILAQVSDPPDWGALTLTRDEYDELDILDQRRFLQTVIDKITIYHDSAIIAYRFPRAADGSRKSRIHLPPPQRGRRITKPRSKKRR